MVESYFEVKKQIKKQTIAPLYLFYGKESFLVEDLLNSLIQTVLSEDEHDFNLSIFDMRETAVDLAVEDAQTLPFIGAKRVVIMKDAYFLTAQKDEWKVDHSLTLLEEYIKNPVMETAFVIVAPYEKLDERKKITKLLKKEAVVVEAQEFDDRLMAEWIINRAKDKRVSLTDDAVGRLIQLLGKNLLLTTNEIDKLALFVGEDGTVTVDVVDELVAQTIEQDIFMLINAIVSRRIDEALSIFFELMKQKEDPIKLIALLARQIRIQYQVKEMARQGYSQKQMASQLKLHPYVVKLSLQQSERASDKQLHELLDRLADLDFQVKTGQMDKQLAVELFLLSLS